MSVLETNVRKIPLEGLFSILLGHYLKREQLPIAIDLHRRYLVATIRLTEGLCAKAES